MALARDRDVPTFASRLDPLRRAAPIAAIAIVVAASAGVVAWLSIAKAGDDPLTESRVARPPVAVEIATVGVAAQTPPHDDNAQSAAPAQASGAELIEVCGLGWVDADPTGSIERTLRAAPEVLASERALLESLRRGGSEIGAALATSLELHGAGRDAGGDPTLALACKAPDCARADEDTKRAAALVERLARQASATRDARVYALAMNACASLPSKGSCALLNAGQWALLADGNAAPWLHLLHDASQREDEAQIGEALYRIGAATRFDEETYLVPGFIAEHAGGDGVDLIAGELLAIDALARASLQATPFQALTKACSGAALADQNRRQACDSAAATLAERSDSLLALAVGTALGRRLGWPDDRVDAIQGLQFASAAMVRERAPDAASGTDVDLPSTCTGARRVLDLFSRSGRVGEVQAVRDWLAASGKSIAPFAQQAHEMFDKRDDADAAAASLAASAPVPTADGSAVEASASVQRIVR